MFIPGILISILTFPGIIVHEWAHKKFCDWLGVPISKIVYFQFGNPAGYVMHEEPKNYAQSFWISIGPFIINSLITIILAFVATLFGFLDSNVGLVLLWVAGSVGMHSFPSNHDMKNVWEASKIEIKKGASPLHYLAFLLVAIVWVANALSFFWFDLIYAGILISVGYYLAGY